jgi:hypothetical protein
MAVSKKYLNAYINADDEFNLVKENEAIAVENLRFSTTDEGTTSKWESILSNAEIANTYLPASGTNTNLNSCPTEDGRYIILFNHNQYGTHGIYAYRKTDNTFYKVLLESQVTGGLGFSKNSLITAKIVNGCVYFTDNLNEVKRVNIEAGIKLNHPSFTTTQSAYAAPLAQSVITLIRKPPCYPLSCAKATSGSVGLTLNNNQVKTFAGRFAWFYTYKNSEVSTLSMHSELVNYNVKDDNSDVILVTANVAEFVEQDVQKVTFVVIYADGEQAFEIKTWDKGNSDDLNEINFHNGTSTPLTFKFTNNEVGAAIDNITFNKHFDSIPNKVKSLERAGGRIFLSNYETGYDTPKTTSLAASVLTNSTLISQAIKSGSSRRIGIAFFDKYMRQCAVVPYSKLVTVANRGFEISSPYTYAIQWTLSNTNAVNEIPDWAYYYTVVSTKDITRNYFLQAFAGEVFYAEKDSEGVYTFKKTEYSTANAGIGLRLNVLNGMGMGYAYSEGDMVNVHVKNNGVTTTATLSVTGVYGDYLICSNHNFGTLNYNSIGVFEVYSPNNKTASNFFYEQGHIYPVINPTEASRTYSLLTDNILGDIYLLEKDSLNQVTYTIPTGRNNADQHTIACNMVSQFAASANFTTGSSPLLSTSGFNENTDNSRWIIKTNSNAVKFNFKGTIKFSSNSGGIYQAWLSVNDGTGGDAYYIVPEQHINSATQYTFDYNLDINVPANSRVFIIAHLTEAISGRFKFYNETSMVVTTVDDAIKSVFETMSPNDNFYQKWFTNAGRLQITSPVGKQTLKTGIRWSNTLIEGTRTNGLSSFDAANQKLLQHELIEINKLVLANKVDEQGQGNVMLAVCPTEIVSMYLGEVQLMSPSQGGSVATTDSVIGSANVLKGSFGSIHPESIIEHKGNVFAFDALGGRFWQYSINGIDNICSGENDVFKFSRFAKRFADKLLSTSTATIEGYGSRPFVFAGVDPHHGEVYWSLPKLGNPPKSYLSDYKFAAGAQPSYLDTDTYTEASVNYDAVTYPYDMVDYKAKTIVYKIRKRWMGSFDWTPEGFCSLDSTLYSIKNGKLYKHGVSGSYNTFYGVQHRSRIAFVCNDQNVIKEGRVLSLESALPEWVHIRSEEPYEQSTDLVVGDFEAKEGVYYSAILRDRLSPNVSGTAYDKQFAGDLMRGKALLVLVQWGKGVQANFRMASIMYNVSSGQY